jgi:hypothetical protein
MTPDLLIGNYPPITSFLNLRCVRDRRIVSMTKIEDFFGGASGTGMQSYYEDPVDALFARDDSGC